MILLALLAALLVGAALGARGFHSLGRRLRGPWRPGVGALALLAGLGGLLLLARAEWLPGGALLAVAVALGLVARRRAAAGARPPTAGGLGRREAAALLGIPAEASPPEVEAAYRRLIRRTHPDAGGTAGLAAQLNAARAVMLGRGA